MDERRGGAAAPITVLVVDDDDDVREVAATALADSGYRVLEAADGDAALALIEKRQDIAVVITDVVMPGTSGFHVARRARRRRPDIKVLLVSAYAPGLVDADIAPAEFLAKPFRVRELDCAVGRLLRR